MPVLTKINTNVIADNAVTAAKIPAGAVDADIGVGSVTASHIAANAVGASELADDAVLPTNIAYLGDGTGKLSGTITGQQLRLGTAFTLTDDLTVNGDLTLSKVRADGTGQSLTHTASTARTLTGTGTLRMGHATEKTSISGFTGLLDEGVTFPAGSIVKWEQVTTTPVATQGADVTYTDLTGSSKSYTPATGASYVVYQYSTTVQGDSSDATALPLFWLYYDGSTVANTNWCEYTEGTHSQFTTGYRNWQFILPAWTGAKTVSIKYRAYSTSYQLNFHEMDNSGDATATHVFTKIYQTTYSVM